MTAIDWMSIGLIAFSAYSAVRVCLAVHAFELRWGPQPPPPGALTLARRALREQWRCVRQCLADRQASRAHLYHQHDRALARRALWRRLTTWRPPSPEHLVEATGTWTWALAYVATCGAALSATWWILELLLGGAR